MGQKMTSVFSFISTNHILELIGFITLILLIFDLYWKRSKTENVFEKNEQSAGLLFLLQGFLLLCSYMILFLRFRNLVYRNVLSIIISVGVTIIVLALTVIAVHASKQGDTVRLNTSKYIHLVNVAILIVSAWLIYSYKIAVNPEFYNDEHYMIKTAYGLINEHQFALWDFVHNTTTENYNGAMLYILCLAIVYKITGLSVVSGRMLSVIFAILFIISLYYIGLNLLKSTETAFLASVIMLLFPGFVEQARLIRMHTLSPLAGIWLFYFGLKVIDCKNNFKKENRFTLFIKKYFDYNLKYVALFFLLLVINTYYLVFQNPWFFCIGLFLYLIFLMIIKGEKKHFILFSVGGILIFLVVIGWNFENITWGYYKEVIEALKLHLTFHFNYPEMSYITSFISHPFGIIMGSVLMVSFIYILCRKWHENEQLIAIVFCYLSCTFIFVFCTSHMFRIRYLLFVEPLLACILAVSFKQLFEIMERFGKKVLRAFLVMGLALSLLTIAVSEYNPDLSRTKLQEAYSKIDSTIDTSKPFAFCSFHYHSEYLTDYSESNYIKMLDSDYLQDSGMKDFIRMGKEYNDGVIVFEADKAHMVTPVYADFRDTWLEQISGQNIDDTNVNIYRYRFEEEDKSVEVNLNDTENYKAEVIDANTVFFGIRIREDINADLLLIQFLNSNGEKKMWQLDIPDDVRPGEVVCYKLKLAEPYFDGAVLQPNMGIYNTNEDTLTEIYY